MSEVEQFWALALVLLCTGLALLAIGWRGLLQ